MLVALLNKMSGNNFSLTLSLNLISTFIIGIGTSHLYRNFIIRNNWLQLRIAQLIPRVLLASFILAFIFYIVHTLISDYLIAQGSLSFEWIDVLQTLINLSANYILWTLLYWSFHFIENYRKEEIKNLRWQATIREMELNKIKSQLNPHFIFNSMNSIRALVDDQPAKSKNLITQLSNILRSSLYMERKPVIPFNEEISLVRDYLSLEKARLEERLEIQLDIQEACNEFEIPPLLVQTLVENAIKHGISKIEGGGRVSIKAWVDHDNLGLRISNTGSLEKSTNGKEGIGLKISRQRLELLYGDKADLKLLESDGMVKAELYIPSKSEKLEAYEGTDH